MLTITHTRVDGTLLDGTSRGDGLGPVLKGTGWRFSRPMGLWYLASSRDKAAATWTIERTVAALEKAGRTVTVEVDDRPRPTADVEADKAVRAQERAEYLAKKAERKDAAAVVAQRRFEAAGRQVPPGGEPIKIGHHSEGRHRRSIERAWSTLGASVQADKDAAAAKERARIALMATDLRNDPKAVASRIEKLEVEQRDLIRRRDGHTRTVDARSGLTETTPPATGADIERVTMALVEVDDKLTYWRGIRTQQQAEGTATNYGAHNVNAGDTVRFRGSWYNVVRANAKSVTVKGTYGQTGRLPWHEIDDHKKSD